MKTPKEQHLFYSVFTRKVVKLTNIVCKTKPTQLLNRFTSTFNILFF